MNLHRRHLDESQRAMVAAKVATLGKGRPSENVEISTFKQADAAKMLNVSRDTVVKAKKVREQGAPELVKAVEDGKIAVSDENAFTSALLAV